MQERSQQHCTVTELAGRLGMSRYTVARWARRGWPPELAWHRRGRRTWVTTRLEVVDAWAAGTWAPSSPGSGPPDGH